MLAFQIRLHSQLFASSRCIVAYSYQYLLCSEYNKTCTRLGLGTETFSELSRFSNCSYWRFRVREFVTVLLIGSQQFLVLCSRDRSGRPPFSLLTST